MYEYGEMDFWPDYPAAGDYAQAMDILEYIVHDPVLGTLATAWKEELQLEIERQKELGNAGLLEEDKYLAEVNLRRWL
jgi:hypothetical protein